MGIVVSIAMLLGLIILRPSPWRSGSDGQLNTQVEEQPSEKLVSISIISLLGCGLWNVLWYGLSHLSEFWGWAAIISGLAMLLASVIIFYEYRLSQTVFPPRIRNVVIAILALCFVLYSVTIVQLNLGLPIIGR